MVASPPLPPLTLAVPRRPSRGQQRPGPKLPTRVGRKAGPVRRPGMGAGAERRVFGREGGMEGVRLGEKVRESPSVVRWEKYVGLLNSANISSLFSPTRFHFDLFQVQTSASISLAFMSFHASFSLFDLPLFLATMRFFLFPVIFIPLSLLFSFFSHLFIYLGTTTLSSQLGSANLQAALLFLRLPSTFPVPGRPFILCSLVFPPGGHPRKHTSPPPPPRVLGEERHPVMLLRSFPLHTCVSVAPFPPA